jgi:hypothetical protein
MPHFAPASFKEPEAVGEVVLAAAKTTSGMANQAADIRLFVKKDLRFIVPASFVITVYC